MTPQPTVDPRAGIGVLPPFMRPRHVKPVYTVAETKSATPHYYLLEKPDAGVFGSIAAVDKHVHKELSGTIRYEPELLPRAGLPDHFLQGGGHLVENASLSNPASTGSGVYIFGSDDLATKVMLWEGRYHYFLDHAERYLQNPGDFFHAYNFVEQHPAFYHRNHPDLDEWEQNSGLAGIWQSVSAGEEPHSVVFLLEHGPYDEESRTQSSHDHLIDAYGDSYEAAIIDLAANVHNYYDLLGMDRPEPLDKRGLSR